MLCPYCNKEMEKGYIQCRDEEAFIPNTVAVAYHCETCKYIAIPYGKNEEDYK